MIGGLKMKMLRKFRGAIAIVLAAVFMSSALFTVNAVTYEYGLSSGTVTLKFFIDKNKAPTTKFKEINMVIKGSYNAVKKAAIGFGETKAVINKDNSVTFTLESQDGIDLSGNREFLTLICDREVPDQINIDYYVTTMVGTDGVSYRNSNIIATSLDVPEAETHPMGVKMEVNQVSAPITCYDDLSDTVKTKLKEEYLDFYGEIDRPGEFVVLGESNGYTICEIWGSLYYPLSKYYNVGDYTFHVLRYPGGQRIQYYVLNDNEIYDLYDAYEKNVIDMSEIANILHGYKTANVYKLHKYVCGDENDDESFVMYNYNYIQNVKGYEIFTQDRGTGESNTVSEFIGDYQVFAQNEHSPYKLGIYVVGETVLTLKEAYDKGIVTDLEALEESLNKYPYSNNRYYIDKYNSFDKLSDNIQSQFMKYSTLNKEPDSFKVIGHIEDYKICELWGKNIYDVPETYYYSNYKFTMTKSDDFKGLPYFIYNDNKVYSVEEVALLHIVRFDHLVNIIGGVYTPTEQNLHKFFTGDKSDEPVNAEVPYYKLGNMRGYDVYFNNMGIKEFNPVVRNIDGYTFTAKNTSEPYDIGIYFISGDIVYTMEQMIINRKFVSGKDVAKLINECKKRDGFDSVTAVEEEQITQPKTNTTECNTTVDEVAVSQITLNASKKVLNVGGTATLKATVSPSNATNKNIVWSTSNKNIVKVNSKGIIKGIKKGTANVYAKAVDGSKKYARCVVTIKQPVTKVKLNLTRKTLKVKQSCKLKAYVYPSYANNRYVRWTSSNKNVAYVKNTKTASNTYNTVIAKKIGSATIRATALDGSKKYANCKIVVKK